ncbi:hypothetical protein Y032_0740g1966 [Ancylostoma ceylanicum]|uniref:Uncharacterized protein n=1 Tax=Ancylostoma ceylanicum TaxID=53326 RepID=A0A016WE84_9BILA|nr:hypothetical protein Y032_0740g1966 [Ancylostoma ceylanicum]
MSAALSFLDRYKPAAHLSKRARLSSDSATRTRSSRCGILGGAGTSWIAFRKSSLLGIRPSDADSTTLRWISRSSSSSELARSTSGVALRERERDGDLEPSEDDDDDVGLLDELIWNKKASVELPIRLT